MDQYHWLGGVNYAAVWEGEGGFYILEHVMVLRMSVIPKNEFYSSYEGRSFLMPFFSSFGLCV